MEFDALWTQHQAMIKTHLSDGGYELRIVSKFCDVGQGLLECERFWVPDLLDRWGWRWQDGLRGRRMIGHGVNRSRMRVP